jgi:2-keto-4-pentenoate hydratase/2-oxohepta-3-ene-1,7-dioic acid hydratase in catechol pathway
MPPAIPYIEAAEDNGELISLEISPKNIYGLGLTYRSHIIELGYRPEPHKPPPVFTKELVSLNMSEEDVFVPTREDLIKGAEGIEPGIGGMIEKDFKRLPPLLDYEGELAFVLLEEVDWHKIRDPDYSVKLGYFLANDISARTIAILGEKRHNRYEYWGASKSFSGFLPVGPLMYIPHEGTLDSILNTTIITTVNGKVRQKESTKDIIYTPREMLIFILEAYPGMPPAKGDVVLTGTPGGVAMQVSAWKAWLANVLDLTRITRLIFSIISGDRSERFLKSGDVVEVSGGILGNIRTQIKEKEPS